MTVEEFLNYLRFERNYSQLTVQSYGEDLRDFESYFKNLDNQLSWEAVDADLIRGWMESMMDKGNTATSVNRRLSALRSFYRFALSQGFVEANPAHAVTGPRKHHPLPQFMKEREVDELLEQDMWGNNYSDMRARTIIMMFYVTGMRLAELVGLDDQMVDFARREISVIGKRNKQRIIPFGDELAETLREYICLRDQMVDRHTKALFVTAKGERMKASQVRYVVSKNVGRVTTLKKRTPHVLRHTFATAMLNHEANLESVKKLLGHESLSTTEIYTHTTFEQLKKVYQNAHPRA
ncbi:MAG: tyrosine recombinase XerC [Prevotella sp.]|nr:tyrosine recombinase XerC [Prevotella sp.]